ncbi:MULTISPECIES: LacI family DNA-binding transcriptional regulator [unclassified Rathayibacter]|uniref:LacI family DNA-binding transcriptional regulator n=2 Tax=Rathayibacter TaxID=33886 RepID=UPI0028007005|nr:MULTISPECIES: LacI family DNA-binding transcriptional regulator [unclassified Rathayibacter]
MTRMSEAHRPGATRHKGPSQSDVAERAGVSKQTVSRVANGAPEVDSFTREKVLLSMTELGYRPNRAARALRSGRYRNIGVVLSTLSSFGNRRTLEAISAEANRAGYSLTLITVDVSSRDETSNAFSVLADQALDGIIIVLEQFHYRDNPDVHLPPGVPVVSLDASRETSHPVVDSDQRHGALLATQHLLDLGHDTVWHVSGPSDSFAALRREAAWREALRERGIEPPATLAGDWSTGSGYRAGVALRERDDVTAVFAANDQMALGVLLAYHEADIPVPGRVSVVGFDDIEEAEAFWPPLTTVRQKLMEVGRVSVRTLVAVIEGREAVDARTTVSTELIVRRSTSSPPPRNGNATDHRGG